MKTQNNLIALFPLVLASTASGAYENLPDSGEMPNVVHLSKECKGANLDLKNCTDNLVDLQDWLWNTRQPSATAPVLVDIGPGTFTGPFECINAGHVTLRGSGPENTVITNDPNVSFSFFRRGMRGKGCVDLQVMDLSIVSSNIGVEWDGSGNSTWNNVDIRVGENRTDVQPTYGWYDGGGIHFWFSSKITVNAGDGSQTYVYSTMGDNWIYGSDLSLVIGSEATGSPKVVRFMGNSLLATPGMRLFGSTVRATVANDGVDSPIARIIGATGSDQGSFHMHGGIISLNAGNSTQNVELHALAVGPGSTAHTPGAAFTLIPPSNGIAIRIVGSGEVRAPFLWPNGTNPPSVQSTTGSDIFVETDCDSNGNCESAGTETHIMIYNDTCNVDGPWFDSTRGTCRGAP